MSQDNTLNNPESEAELDTLENGGVAPSSKDILPPVDEAAGNVDPSANGDIKEDAASVGGETEEGGNIAA